MMTLVMSESRDYNHMQQVIISLDWINFAKSVKSLPCPTCSTTAETNSESVKCTATECIAKFSIDHKLVMRDFPQ